MDTKGTKMSKNSLLKIGSNLTIDCTADLQAKFTKAINKKQNIKISSELIETIDLSGIQLLLLMKENNRSNNLVEFNLLFSDNTRELLVKCGFSDYIFA